MSHVMTCSSNPVDFVKANFVEISRLIKIMCKKFGIQNYEDDILSEFILQLLQGRHKYDPRHREVHDGKSMPSSVTTYMYSVAYYFVMDRKKRIAHDAEIIPVDRSLNVETIPEDENFTTAIEETDVIKVVKTALAKVVMGRGSKIRLFRILKMTMEGIGNNEIGRRMGLSGALISYHLRALKIFCRHVLSGVSPQKAWNEARPALVGKLAGKI